MNCTSFEPDISKLLDNELGEDRQVATFSHLASCPPCREFFHTSRYVRRHVEAVPAYPEELDDRIHNLAERQKHASVFRFRTSIFGTTVRVPLPAAAAVLFALAVSIFLTVDALQGAGGQEPNVIYVPTLPAVHVSASVASTPNS